jgi:hypothetical protein
VTTAGLGLPAVDQRWYVELCLHAYQTTGKQQSLMQPSSWQSQAQLIVCILGSLSSQRGVHNCVQLCCCCPYDTLSCLQTSCACFPRGPAQILQVPACFLQGLLLSCKLLQGAAGFPAGIRLAKATGAAASSAHLPEICKQGADMLLLWAGNA